MIPRKIGMLATVACVLKWRWGRTRDPNISVSVFRACIPNSERKRESVQVCNVRVRIGGHGIVGKGESSRGGYEKLVGEGIGMWKEFPNEKLFCQTADKKLIYKN